MDSAKSAALSLLCACFMLQGCQEDGNKQAFNELRDQPIMLDIADRNYNSAEPLRPLPDANQLVFSLNRVNLGNRLFHDPRLSGDGTVSCASCHNLARGGDDDLKFGVGIDQAVGHINVPTVLNSSFNFVQFWNGRAATLQEQAEGPVANPIEMGANWDEVESLLSDSGQYDRAFTDAFGDKTITKERITQAIADFESVLITPSPFDRYLRGDETAITSNAVKGYELFKQHGCASCHQGINVGSNLYQKFGAVESYFKIATEADKGRLVVTQNAEDLSLFKVPSLRNVALTSPYFHTGTVNDLEMAIRIMGVAQLGINLSEEDIGLIAEFLQSLTGEKNLLSEISLVSAGDGE